jgi:hypothetical protein
MVGELSTAATPGGMLTLVLAEQMCCIRCGTVSARWQIPAGDVPTSRKSADELQDVDLVGEIVGAHGHDRHCSGTLRYPQRGKSSIHRTGCPRWKIRVSTYRLVGAGRSWRNG